MSDIDIRRGTDVVLYVQVAWASRERIRIAGKSGRLVAVNMISDSDRTALSLYVYDFTTLL
jgi:hypothetical protein